MTGLMKYRDDNKENPLRKRPDLLEEALDRFSRLSYHEASLNAILKKAAMNKGSFYFFFYNKMDLYLCLLEILGTQRIASFGTGMHQSGRLCGFFEQLTYIARSYIELGSRQPRYLFLSRNYLNESDELKSIVNQALPGFAGDRMELMVEEAIQTGQVKTLFDRQFIYKMIRLYFDHIDSVMEMGISAKELPAKVEQLVLFLKSGLAAD